eukprot:315564-Chlamydomonas_euryale.AAC.1
MVCARASSAPATTSMWPGSHSRWRLSVCSACATCSSCAVPKSAWRQRSSAATAEHTGAANCRQLRYAARTAVTCVEAARGARATNTLMRA